jgi:hypothetical protein
MPRLAPVPAPRPAAVPAVTAPPRRGHGLRLLALALGTAISLAMVSRSQVGGDQLLLLARGWLLAAEGTWIHYGMPTSAGGASPGSVTSLLAGAPLLLWRDYRAPTLLLWLSHLLAYLLLDRVVAAALGARGRTLFALLYWLNPWRVFFSAHLWNANAMFLAGALHAWTSFRQRQRGSFALSFVHVLTIGVAAQLHSSAPILAFASLLLLWRRWLRLHWGGAIAGALVAAASLVPWVITVSHHPELLPGHTGFPFRGLVLLFPLLRGVFYWLRYPSLLLTERMVQPDFTASLGPLADRALAAPLSLLITVGGGLTVLGPLLATRWMWRADRHRLRRPFDPSRRPRLWLHAYVATAFAAAVISFAASPTTIMAWQGFVVFHAAVLPPLLWLEALLRSRARRRALLGVRAWAAVVVPLLVAMTLAAPLYRRGGRDAVTVTLAAPLPLLAELGVDRHCTVIVDPTARWWLDVLPRPPAR